MKNRTPTDADDLFADTRMSFGDHVEDLRMHLWRAVLGFFGIILFCFLLDGIGVLFNSGFGVAVPVMHFIAKPVEDALEDFYNKRIERVAQDLKEGRRKAVAVDMPKDVEMELDISPIKKSIMEAMKANPPSDPPPEYVGVRGKIAPLSWTMALARAQQMVVKPARLSTLSVTEAFVVYLKVALVCGIVLSSPWVFWQIWSFIAAGLYPHEKRYVNVYLPISLLLFLMGVVFCELAVLPQAVKALLWFNEWLDLEPELRLNEWLSFAIWTPIIFGISFETPLVMLFIERLGIINVETFRDKRRIAWFALAFFAAVVTPTDLLSMLFLWVPMCGLYELGILLCQISPRRESSDLDVPESEEMVEV